LAACAWVLQQAPLQLQLRQAPERHLLLLLQKANLQPQQSLLRNPPHLPPLQQQVYKAPQQQQQVQPLGGVVALPMLLAPQLLLQLHVVPQHQTLPVLWLLLPLLLLPIEHCCCQKQS
jgi:hypothetical protein